MLTMLGPSDYGLEASEYTTTGRYPSAPIITTNYMHRAEKNSGGPCKASIP